MAVRVAVIGAGLMGSGIAQVAAQAGYDVVMRDTTSEALDRAMAAIVASQSRFVTKGTITAVDAEAARARIVTTTDLDEIAGAGIVVEAVFEQLEVKHEVFRAIDDIVGADAILATNTTA
ncbi:MAG: 3-hydroxybutyryl-CoA dehydrogenase, partial [Actinomycetota bacterium]|nr:3-hydroxybutyryl-CoA dehydrogenase [Actinomycetota bacterium]